MDWHRGNWTSYRNDKGAFIECADDHKWFVYDTNKKGRIDVISTDPLEFKPPVAGPFPEMAQAETWSETNQPAR